MKKAEITAFLSLIFILLVSFCGSFVLLTVKQKFIPWLIGIILVGYSALMIGTGSLLMLPAGGLALLIGFVLFKKGKL